MCQLTLFAKDAPPPRPPCVQLALDDETLDALVALMAEAVLAVHPSPPSPAEVSDD